MIWDGMPAKIFRYSKVFAAEFEPGILDSYKSEDKLHEILSYMDKDKIFWLSDFILKGSQRITSASFDSIFKSKITKKITMHALKKSPGWAELIFINSFKKPELFSKRDYLLGWIFSTINNQHGFSLYLAEEGSKRFDDNFFNELVQYSKRKIRTGIFSLQLLSSIKNRLFKIFSN
jgi:hypothetical protein